MPIRWDAKADACLLMVMLSQVCANGANESKTKDKVAWQDVADTMMKLGYVVSKDAVNQRYLKILLKAFKEELKEADPEGAAKEKAGDEEAGDEKAGEDKAGEEEKATAAAAAEAEAAASEAPSTPSPPRSRRPSKRLKYTVIDSDDEF